jgi:hypothetical protein
MPPFRTETLDWLDKLAALKAQVEKTPDASYAKLAKAINDHKSNITFLMAIKACFDPAAIEKVKRAAPSFILSFNSAKELSALNGKVADLSPIVTCPQKTTPPVRL